MGTNKDSERIYHIERKVDEILALLKQGYLCPGHDHPLPPVSYELHAEAQPTGGIPTRPLSTNLGGRLF